MPRSTMDCNCEGESWNARVPAAAFFRSLEGVDRCGKCQVMTENPPAADEVCVESVETRCMSWRSRPGGEMWIVLVQASGPMGQTPSGHHGPRRPEPFSGVAKAADRPIQGEAL